MHQSTLISVKSKLLDVSGRTSTAFCIIASMMGGGEDNISGLLRQTKEIRAKASTIIAILEVQNERNQKSEATGD